MSPDEGGAETRELTLVQRALATGNRRLGWLLSSPRLTRLLGLEPIRIRYVGPRSGRTIELPAWAKSTDNGLLVRVGLPAQKRWWRTFRRARPIQIHIDGGWRAGTAVVREPKPGAVEVIVTWAAPTQASAPESTPSAP